LRNSARKLHEQYREILDDFSRYCHAFEKFAYDAPTENKVRRPKKDPKIVRYVQNVWPKTDKMILHFHLEL